MNIGFDAKRIYQNKTGLGNFARTLIDALSTIESKNTYHLFAPKKTNLFEASGYNNIVCHFPENIFYKNLKWLWRSSAIVKLIQQNNLDVYHGLSFELPIGIHKLNIKKIVSVHDLVFERYPHQYSWIDVHIHRAKTKYACKVADAISVLSQQTKDDIINFYKIPAHKIHVTYLSIHENFYQQLSAAALLFIQQKYALPQTYFLYVGSIIERKGLMKICEALLIASTNIPVVVIGKGNNDYAKKVKEFISKNNLSNKVIFLSELDVANQDGFDNSNDLPAIYQNAVALIYPSIFEGFGMPVLEALASGIPCITSNVSCLPEAGGDAAIYVNPMDANEIAQAMSNVLHDEELKTEKIKLGLLHAQNFTKEKLVERMMCLYKDVF